MFNIFEYCITMPLGYIIEWIYRIIPNYGVAIIIFTFIIKMILLPLQIKSQKAMRKTQKVQPLLAELQKKYANDQEKLQREMMKLYKENNISMTGGCLPLLVQMPILIGLYQVIQRPLTYLVHVDFTQQEALDKVISLRDAIAADYPNLISRYAQSSAEDISNLGQIQLSNWSNKINGPNDPWAINFNFLGLDLSSTPWDGLNQFITGGFSDFALLALILIPAIAVALTFLQSKITQIQSGQSNKTNDDSQAAQMSKTMTMMMPIMTGFFTFTFASGLGIYWIASSAVQIIQQVVLNKYFEKKGDEIIVTVPEKRNHPKSKKRK